MAKSPIIKSTQSANKSWVELCDELSDNSSNSSFNDSNKVEINVSEISVKIDSGCAIKEVQSCSIAIKKEREICHDENTPVKISADFIKLESKSETNEKTTSPWNFSYASVLKNSASKDNVTPSPITPTKQTVEKVEAVESINEKQAKVVKREIQREFLQDDLSLSSHLDVFHMQSPLKLEPVDEDMASPTKFEREKRSAKKRLGEPKMLLENEDSVMPDELMMPSPKKVKNEDSVMLDEVLMPSPKKVTRLSSRRKRESGESPLTNKRSKYSSGRYSTPKCVVSVEPPIEELETDEQVLMRRQKQIDYGKNTVGYDRYCQTIPKLKRNKKHPQTPPKNIKYSRRAWDGLVKQWRQQLHFWDPPSEGGGNIDDLNMSFTSEASSDAASVASSLSSTPRDVGKSKRHSRVTRSSESSHGTAEDSGCSPLK